MVTWTSVIAKLRQQIIDHAPDTMLAITLVSAALLPQPSARLAIQQQPAACSRRGVLVHAAGALAAFSTVAAANAEVSDIGKAGLSKEEFYAALAKRKKEEEFLALPINQLKAKRDQFAKAPTLIEAGDFDGLRDLITSTTGPSLTALIKTGRFGTKEVLAYTNKMRKVLFEVDTFAYSQQNFPGADLFAGYCAEGVIPREEGGCKVRPTAEKAPYIALAKDASALFDQLVAAAEK